MAKLFENVCINTNPFWMLQKNSDFLVEKYHVMGLVSLIFTQSVKNGTPFLAFLTGCCRPTWSVRWCPVLLAVHHPYKNGKIILFWRADNDRMIHK